MHGDNPYNPGMNERSSYTIDVQVEPRFVPDQSRPGDNRYVFAYTITLHNAGAYITKLPKAEQDAEPWQAAMEALLLVAEHDGPTSEVLDTRADVEAEPCRSFGSDTPSKTGILGLCAQ